MLFPSPVMQIKRGIVKNFRPLILVCLFIGTALATQLLSRSEIIRPHRPFASFPAEIASWRGEPAQLDGSVTDILGVEDYLLATYRHPRGRAVNLYVGYYQSQKEGDLIHSPRNCMPGGGWHILETGREPLVFPGAASAATAARLLIENGPDRQIVLYWFQSRGRIIASEYMQKIWLVVDAVTRRRTDGSFVRLMAPVTTTEAETLEMLKEFARQIKPHLDAHIPS